jgi:ureidoacrylate peracid hydrolase
MTLQDVPSGFSPTRRTLPRGRITPANTALLVIDMERDFVDDGAAMQTPGALRIVPVINRLVDWARQYRLPVIFTHEMHRPDQSDMGIEGETDPVHCVDGTAGCELTAGLDARPGDYHILNKRRYDSFHATDLDLLLRCRRVENLVCCGVTTHQCVMSTVFSARHLDYRAIVPQEAVAAVSPAHQVAGLLCMSDVFAYVVNLDAVLSLWS